MDNVWNIKELTEAEKALCEQLAGELHISNLSAQMLVDRGLTTANDARAYIRPNLNQLHDPFLMKDMDKAVERLHRAIETGEHILIYGDYDVDGTTSVTLMVTFLKDLINSKLSTLNSKLSTLNYYIPDRYTEGYGISFKGIDYAKEIGCTLIIALDCGIKAIDKVAYATSKGIDFIICDHHTPGDELPAAVAVLDMERKDDDYPYKHLSGCGVGYKLCCAYTLKYLTAKQSCSEAVLQSLLQYLAMSIASDIVPITGENRILITYGLKELNERPKIGPKAIIDVAGLANQTITITDLGFKIGPRINACGRMKSGIEAVNLLLSENAEESFALAQAVDAYNQERKGKEDTITTEALEQLAADPENEHKHTTVVYNPNWHKGVVGIAASKLIETYYRPTIVLTGGGDGLISGSARSVEGFDLYSAIDACSDLLTTFGGHLFAAGLTLPEANLEAFKVRFDDYVKQHILPEQQQPTLNIEAEIALEDITPQFFKVLQCLEPFGPENPRPLFVTRNMVNNRYTKRCGKTGEHLKLDLTDGTAAISGIAFGKGDAALYIQNGNKVDVVYELEENVFNGVHSIEMRVKDIRYVQ
ncbi:MAG: single-stranded-DNA-specific exonuclease RecJ [Paludibacteraceae bacterium]|nr:single-stranded-DNA-specific exonuclease RecJ [Paludibacteraceae bacterium]